MLSDAELRSLTREERASLTQRLVRLNAADVVRPERGRYRARMIALLAGACAVLAPWLAVLALTLPKHYVAAHWRLTWVGFDLALLVGLAMTAFYAWRRRQAMVMAGLVTGTLLLSDAWFDVTTANGSDRMTSLLSALLLELPLGFVLVRTALRLVRLTVATTRALMGADTGPVRLRRMPLLGAVPHHAGPSGDLDVVPQHTDRIEPAPEAEVSG